MTDLIELALSRAEAGVLPLAVEGLMHGVADRNFVSLSAAEQTQAWHLLALLHKDMGQADAAVAALQQVLHLQPNMGLELLPLFMELGCWAEAEAILQVRVAECAEDAQAWLALAHCAYAQGRLTEAKEYCDQAVNLQGPLQAQALSNRSMLYSQLGEVAQAKADALVALDLQPDFIGARLNLALAQLGLHELEACVENCERVLADDPVQPAALINAALAEMEMKQQAQAQNRLKKLLQAQPEHLQALEQLIISCYHTLDVQGTQRYLSRRLALKHDLAGRWLALMATIPLMPTSRTEAKTSRRTFMRDLMQMCDWIKKNKIEDRDCLVVQEGISPFYYLYHGINDKNLLESYGEVCVRLLEHVQNGVEEWQQAGGKSVRKGKRFSESRPLRFGVVSSHIRSHAIWQDKIKGLYKFCPEDVEIYTFAVEGAGDADTQYAKVHSAHFQHGGWRLNDWAQRIAEQDLDIIYYPEIGLSAQVFRLACLRLAPVQMTSWGNPLTSGVPTIDHFVSARVFEDAEGAQSFYSERLHMLDAFPSYYEHYQGKEEAFDASEFGLDFSKKLLLCAGTTFKYQFDFAEHYADIAAMNEGVQLVFFAYDKEMFGRVRVRLQETFAGRGIAAEKLIFMPWLSREQYQYLMRKSYLLLDSLDFSGINTVLQALEVDLPVVTMRGEMLRGRLGSGVLDAVGLQNWVAQSRQEYVDGVQRLVVDPALRLEYQAQLQVVRSQMFENRAAVDEFYAIVRSVCLDEREC